MGLFGPPKKKPTTFKVAVEKAAAALQVAEERAVTPEETKAVADGWIALVSELNPSNAFDSKDKKDD